MLDPIQVGSYVSEEAADLSHSYFCFLHVRYCHCFVAINPPADTIPSSDSRLSRQSSADGLEAAGSIPLILQRHRDRAHRRAGCAAQLNAGTKEGVFVNFL